MNYKNRSDNYNWFKGNQGNGKSTKDQWKTAWKVSKIFIYFSLFVFSMVGCVQSMVIATSNYVGTGLELYASEEEIVPNITEIYAVKSTRDTEDADGDSTTKAKIVYKDFISFNSSKLQTNTMIEKNEAINGKANALGMMHSQVNSTNAKMSDAYRGINQAFRYNTSSDATKAVDGLQFTGKVSQFGLNEDLFLLLSSAANKPHEGDVYNKTLIERFNGVKNGTDYDMTNTYYYWNSKLVKVPHANVTIETESTDVKDWQYWGVSTQPETLGKIVFRNKIETKDEDNKWYVVNERVQAVDNFGTGKGKTISWKKSIPYDYEFVKQHILYGTYDKETNEWTRHDVFSEGTKGVRDQYKLMLLDDLLTRSSTIKNLLQMNPETYTSDQIDFTSVDGETKPSIQDHHRAAYLFGAKGNILSTTAGTMYKLEEVTNNDKEVVGMRFSEGTMVGAFAGETNYRPIVSWGDSWKLGPFYGLFVWPLGKLSAIMISGFPIMDGWGAFFSILIIVLLSRIFTFLLSFKSTIQQTKMQELGSKKAQIDAKYMNYKDNKQMMNRQKQEVAELYKKEGINPLGAMGSMFLTMPIFLAIWRIISGVPMLKSTIWLGMTFSETSWKMLFGGAWQYLPIIVIAALVQYISIKYPQWLTKKRDKQRMNAQQEAAMKKNNKTQNIMSMVMVFMAVIFTAGVQVYWIIGGLWRLVEVSITHNMLHKKKPKKGEEKVSLIAKVKNIGPNIKAKQETKKAIAAKASKPAAEAKTKKSKKDLN